MKSPSCADHRAGIRRSESWEPQPFLLANAETQHLVVLCLLSATCTSVRFRLCQFQLEKSAARIIWNAPNVQVSGVSLPAHFWKRHLRLLFPVLRWVFHFRIANDCQLPSSNGISVAVLDTKSVVLTDGERARSDLHGSPVSVERDGQDCRTADRGQWFPGCRSGETACGNALGDH